MTSKNDYLDRLGRPNADEFEWAMFVKDGKIKYNAKCQHCTKKCKQSWQAVIVRCPLYEGRQSKGRGKQV